MNALMKEEVLGTLLDHASAEGNATLADFQFDTIVQAEEGKMISADDVKDLIDGAREKGIPLASLIKARGVPNARAITIVTPGPGVVEQANRSGRGSKRETYLVSVKHELTCKR